MKTETKIPNQEATIKTHLGIYREEKDSFGYLKEYYRLSMFAGTHQVLTKKEPDSLLPFKREFQETINTFTIMGA